MLALLQQIVNNMKCFATNTLACSSGTQVRERSNFYMETLKELNEKYGDLLKEEMEIEDKAKKRC